MRVEEVFFPIPPIAKGRPRLTRYGQAYTPKKTKDYEKAIAEHFKGQNIEKFEGPIHIKLVFQMPIPKSFTKKQRGLIQEGFMKYDKKPDLDNLAKAVLDALNGIAYEDDSKITGLFLVKRYSNFPGTTMTIREDDT